MTLKSFSFFTASFLGGVLLLILVPLLCGNRFVLDHLLTICCIYILFLAFNFQSLKLFFYLARGRVLYHRFFTLAVPTSETVLTFDTPKDGNVVIFFGRVSPDCLRGYISIRNKDRPEIVYARHNFPKFDGIPMTHPLSGEKSIGFGKRAGRRIKPVYLPFSKGHGSGETSLDIDLEWNFIGTNSIGETRIPKDRMVPIEIMIKGR